MTGRTAAMGDLGNDPGERAEAARKRRFRVLMAVYVAVAMLIVAGTAVSTRAGHRVTPGWAIAFALLYIGIALVGGWRMYHLVDEVENRDNRVAVEWAGCFYGLTYPVWLFLWKGGLVPEPDHVLMFLGFVFVATATYLARKIF
ncbi:MAG: hypothetical protein ABIO86_05905 [Sphingomonas sp.]